MALPRFEKAIQAAIGEKAVVNAVVVASSRDKNFRYEKAFGKLSLEENSPDIQLDTVFRIFSCTKLVTSIAVMQCVERGLVTLDEPISRIVPEWSSPIILTGLDSSDEFISHAATTPLTLRHLLTHTSGMGYGVSHPLLTEWSMRHPDRLDQGLRGNVREGYLLPLVFEPGKEGMWMYGTGIDWAGQVVERLNGGERLGEYFERDIFGKLGIRDCTFRPLQRKDMMERLCPRVERQADGLIMHYNIRFRTIEPEDDSGGGGLYATSAEYHKILNSIVANDGKLLKESSIDEMFKPQLSYNEELQKTLSQAGYARVIAKDVPGGSSAVKWNHCLAGLAAPDGVPGVAAKGTIWWDGLANTIWFMDRVTGTCAFYGSQLLPASDRQTDELFITLEKELFDLASK